MAPIAHEEAMSQLVKESDPYICPIVLLDGSHEFKAPTVDTPLKPKRKRHTRTTWMATF